MLQKYDGIVPASRGVANDKDSGFVKERQTMSERNRDTLLNTKREQS